MFLVIQGTIVYLLNISFNTHNEYDLSYFYGIRELDIFLP